MVLGVPTVPVAMLLDEPREADIPLIQEQPMTNEVEAAVEKLREEVELAQRIWPVWKIPLNERRYDGTEPDETEEKP
jgi:hypothetical protein